MPETQTEREKVQKVEDLLKPDDSLLVKEVEADILNDLTSRQLDTKSNTTKVLTRHLAITQIVLDFEQTHSIIFGGQIFLLKKLNEVAGQGLPQQFVIDHHKHVQNMFHEELAGWSLQQYLSFLFSRRLITLENDRYHITVRGAEFLVWMARTGHTDNKAL